VQVGVLKAAGGGRHPHPPGVGAIVGALFPSGRTPADIEHAAQDVVIGRMKRWTVSRHGL